MRPDVDYLFERENHCREEETVDERALSLHRSSLTAETLNKEFRFPELIQHMVLHIEEHM